MWLRAGRRILVAYCLLAAHCGPAAAAQPGWLRRLLPQAACTAPAPISPVHRIWIFNTEFLGEFKTRKATAEAFPGAEVRVLNFPADIEAFAAGGHDWPDLIVHSFAQDGEVDKLLEFKRRSCGRTSLTVIGDPKSASAEIDQVVLPRYMDAVKTDAHVFRPLGLPSSITPARLEQVEGKWHELFENLPRPTVALLVGGQSQQKVFSQAVASELSANIKKVVKAAGGALLVTSSRRTPEKAMQALVAGISGVPIYIHDLRSAQTDAPNPYEAFLLYADHIVVTGDSVSMLSDAVATGKPVYVFAPNSIMEDRHKRYVLDLIETGRVRLLGGELETWSYPRLDAATEIARDLERRRSCQGRLQP